MKKLLSALALFVLLAACLVLPMSEGNLSGTSAAATEDGARVTIERVSVRQGDYAYLYLHAEGLENISAIELALTYDASVFEYRDAYAGDLLPSDALTEINGEEAGVLTLYALSANGFSGDGTLWRVNLYVKDNAPVGDRTVQLFAGECIDVSLAPVAVTASGTVISVEKRPQYVQNIYLYGSASNSTLERGDTVSVSFYSYDLYGLAAAEMEISYDDRLLALESAQAGATLLAHGQASVNADSTGYVKISYIAMNGVQGYSDVVTLTFSVLADSDAETRVTLTMDGICNAELVPMSASEAYVSLSLRKKTQQVQKPQIYIADLSARGDRFAVPVVAAGETHLAAGDFTVQYDRSLLKCTEAAGNQDYFTVVNNDADKGLVRFSFIAEDGITEDTPLVTLTFEKVSNGPFTAALSLTGTDLADAELNPIAADIHGGTLVSLCHAWENRPAREATCTESGNPAYEECTVCGARRGYEEYSPKGHRPQVTEGKDATCTEDGLTQGSVCSVCGAVLSKQEPIAAYGHTMSEVSGSEATCTEDGTVHHFHCGRCNNDFEDREGERQLDGVVIPALGHDMAEHERVPASCTEDGTVHHFHCGRCNKNFEDRAGRTPLDGLTIPATGHRYGEPAWEWEGFTAATATFRCQVCGDTQSRVGSVEMVETTTECTVDNVYTATVTFLEKTYTRKKTETLSGTHSLGDWIPGRAAGCEETGERGHYVCTKCGKYLDEDGKTELGEIELPARGHQIDFADRQPPTCTEEGTEAHFVCSECGKMFADAEGDEPIESPARIPALGHSYGDPVWEWKEDNTASAHFSCISGDHELVLDGDCHADTTNFPPTCTEDGKIIYYAIVQLGDKQYSASKQEKVEKLGHTSMPVEGRDATCTETGLTAGTKCAVCGVTLEEQTEIPAKGHRFGDWQRLTAPTYTVEGTERRTCDVCGATEDRSIPALGLAEQFKEEVAAIAVASSLSRKYTAIKRAAETWNSMPSSERAKAEEARATLRAAIEAYNKEAKRVNKLRQTAFGSDVAASVLAALSELSALWFVGKGTL